MSIDLVSLDDSALGEMSRWPNKGIVFNRYDEMIKVAFHERWWKSPAAGLPADVRHWHVKRTEIL